MNYLLWIILLAVSFPALAQWKPITLPLYEEIPNSKPSDEEEEIVAGNMILISKVQEPSIQVFLPSKKNSNRQAVVICPGGGYSVLAYDWEGTDIAKWLNSHGIAGIVLKYRLPSPESQQEPSEAPLMDAKRAMRLTREHAEEWNIDPEQIGVIGFSAGGHLASTLGTHFDKGDAGSDDPVEKFSSRPDFMILGYPVISFNEQIGHLGSRNNLLGDSPTEALVEKFSNELQVAEDNPPTFIFHSQDDTAVPVENSLVFYKALRQAKVPAEMHLYPKGGHGYSLGLDSQGTHSTWPTACIEWLQELRQ